MIKWIRTSRLSIKNSLSLQVYSYTPHFILPNSTAFYAEQVSLLLLLYYSQA